MEQIRKLWEQTLQLNDQEWHDFSSRLNRETFPKKHLLLRVGETEKHLSFIEQGMVRFYIPGEENELTFDFVFENSFVSGYSSFLTQTPAVYQIETLSETILWRLTHEDLQTIYRETAMGNLLGRKASEQLFLKKTKRELSLLSESAEQRYLNLFTEQPELIRQIPLKYIASYIGITPQALSRIRKRITR